MLVDVQYGSFTVGFGDWTGPDNPDEYLRFPAEHGWIIDWAYGALTIATGLHVGDVDVDIRVLQSDPGPAHLAPAQELDEMSIETHGTRIVVQGFDWGHELPERLPASSSGVYRVRCIATNRERDEPVAIERFQVSIWPTGSALPRSERQLKNMS